MTCGSDGDSVAQLQHSHARPSMPSINFYSSLYISVCVSIYIYTYIRSLEILSLVVTDSYNDVVLLGLHVLKH